jgi:hypothetical protein
VKLPPSKIETTACGEAFFAVRIRIAEWKLQKQFVANFKHRQ